MSSTSIVAARTGKSGAVLSPELHTPQRAGRDGLTSILRMPAAPAYVGLLNGHVNFVPGPGGTRKLKRVRTVHPGEANPKAAQDYVIACSILMDYLGNIKLAKRLHRAFRSEVLKRRMHTGHWRVEKDEIDAWLRRKGEVVPAT